MSMNYYNKNKNSDNIIEPVDGKWFINIYQRISLEM